MSIKSILKAVIPSVSRGLLAFGVFGVALYAYGAITFPSSSPTTPSGVLGIYAGYTSSSHDGDPGTYSNANSLCNSDFSGSHVCTIGEMINSYNHGVTLPTSGSAVWVTSGPTFSGAYVANDCSGWTSNSGSALGAVWFFDGGTGYSGITPCSVSYRYACCK